MCIGDWSVAMVSAAAPGVLFCCFHGGFRGCFVPQRGGVLGLCFVISIFEMWNGAKGMVALLLQN